MFFPSVLFKLGTRREFHDMEQEKCRVQVRDRVDFNVSCEAHALEK